MKRVFFKSWISLLILLALAPGLSASVLTVANVQEASTAEEWRFRLTPYLWAAGISGEFSQFGLPVVEVSERFSDVMENLDFGAMAVFEAWRGRYGLFADVSHIRVSGQATVPGLLPVPVSVSASNTSTTGMLAGQFRWIEKEHAYLDLLAGVRHWSLKSELSIGAPLSLSRSERVEWSDPVVGVKGLCWLSENTYLTGWALTGGYVGNADAIVDLMLGVGYKMTEHSALILGYRSMQVDYREDAFAYDAVQQGFGLGLDIRF